MEFKLNSSPHLKMHEITKKLFNNKFLSDIQFSVGGKVIYAHTLELMKRSEVFEVELEETWGEQKLIPIVDCKYENFLEFLRYLYTDECTININNGIELLKLATKYKVIVLENRVINLLDKKEWVLHLFEHCVVNKYEIARRRTDQLFKLNLAKYLKSGKFLAFHPDAVDEVLKFDEIRQGVTEIQIFNAFADWIQNYCQQHQMSLAEGRQKFDSLLRKIRFPVMSNEEIRQCVKKYPGLVSESDCMSIGKQILYGSDDLWISKRRIEINHFRQDREFNCDTLFQSTFSVTKDTIFYGFWIGIQGSRKEIETEISSLDVNTKKTDTIQFIQTVPASWQELVIVLGDSLRLTPNYEYTVTIKYLAIIDQHINVKCRNKNIDFIYNNPENSIKTMKASDNMIEMFFKSPPA